MIQGRALAYKTEHVVCLSTIERLILQSAQDGEFRWPRINPHQVVSRAVDELIRSGMVAQTHRALEITPEGSMALALDPLD